MVRDELLLKLGEQVRLLREQQALSRVALGRAAGLSTRFLAELEGGTGNISVLRLDLVARALGVRASTLLAAAELGSPPPTLFGGNVSGGSMFGRNVLERPVIALLGLRGAGKSTVGTALARTLSLPLVELDLRIEQSAGLSLGQLFELHGERYFRRLERQTLVELLSLRESLVVATGGGIVTDEETLDLLRRRTTTVWLCAKAQDHWDRVVAQGDRRPMANRTQAMEELQALLTSRSALYSLADIVVDTSELNVAASVRRIIQRLHTGVKRMSD